MTPTSTGLARALQQTNHRLRHLPGLPNCGQRCGNMGHYLIMPQWRCAVPLNGHSWCRFPVGFILVSAGCSSSRSPTAARSSGALPSWSVTILSTPETIKAGDSKVLSVKILNGEPHTDCRLQLPTPVSHGTGSRQPAPHILMACLRKDPNHSPWPVHLSGDRHRQLQRLPHQLRLEYHYTLPA